MFKKTVLRNNDRVGHINELGWEIGPIIVYYRNNAQLWHKGECVYLSHSLKASSS